MKTAVHNLRASLSWLAMPLAFLLGMVFTLSVFIALGPVPQVSATQESSSNAYVPANFDAWHTATLLPAKYKGASIADNGK